MGKSKNIQIYWLLISLQGFKKEMFSLYYSAFLFGVRGEWGQSVHSLGHVDSLWPHEPQHARPPCPSPTPRAYSNSCPSSRWCHPAISSSVTPFSSLRSFPASGSFLVSQFFTSGGQSVRRQKGSGAGIAKSDAGLVTVCACSQKVHRGFKEKQIDREGKGKLQNELAFFLGPCFLGDGVESLFNWYFLKPWSILRLFK